MCVSQINYELNSHPRILKSSFVFILTHGIHEVYFHDKHDKHENTYENPFLPFFNHLRWLMLHQALLTQVIGQPFG